VTRGVNTQLHPPLAHLLHGKRHYSSWPIYPASRHPFNVPFTGLIRSANQLWQNMKPPHVLSLCPPATGMNAF
jgi:hypothetical protein